jgi:hypothetical protein
MALGRRSRKGTESSVVESSHPRDGIENEQITTEEAAEILNEAWGVLESEGEREVTEVAEQVEAAPEAVQEEKPKGWTPERRAAQAERMRKYWAENQHPLKGSTLSEERKNAQRERMVALRQRESLADCDRCGGPIHDETYAPFKLGGNCLRKAQEAGEVEIRDGVRVDLKPLTLIGKALKAQRDAEKAAAAPAEAPEESTAETSDES